MSSSLRTRLISTLFILPAFLLSATTVMAGGEVEHERTEERIETEERAAPAEPVPDTRVEADRREVREEVRVREGTGNYMLVVTRSAFLGGVLGALVGGAGYLISGREWSLWNIAYFGAGGVLVGATVGLVEVMMREARRPATASLEWMEREMPTTVQVPVLHLDF
ncbi:MAG: hypothetical protein ACNA8W_00495 [Bradymonadaceae bacterium]